jgi:hypothetical protein
MGKLLGVESLSDSQEINEHKVAFGGKMVNPPIAPRSTAYSYILE